MERPLPPIESTLRRVVVGLRVLAFFWMLGLVIATLSSDDHATKGWVIASLILAALGTGGMVLAARHDRLINHVGWLVGDGAIALFVLMAPGLAGSDDLFFGAYPLSWMLYVAYVLPGVRAMTAAVAITIAGQMFTNITGTRSVSPTNAVGDIAVWIVSGAVYGWGFWALRTRDEQRIIAEAAYAEERLRRRMADERAEIAAHLHDSVLQTLALVQHDADDATRVSNIARTQELELRRYLDEIASRHDRSLRAELRGVAARVEEMHHVRMDVVVVGDCSLESRSEALIAAAREAMRNAARHAGVEEVSVYAEVTPDEVRVFVRDRGRGFDLDEAVGHRGVAASINDRMHRHGGVALIRSVEGEGTEVEPAMPRDAS